MGEQRKMYGWYSPKQAAHFENTAERYLRADASRCCIYEDASDNEAVVTEVTEKPEPYGSWGDYQSLGELKRFIRFQ